MFITNENSLDEKIKNIDSQKVLEILNFMYPEHEGKIVKTSSLKDLKMSDFDLMLLIDYLEQETKIKIPEESAQYFETPKDYMDYLINPNQ